MARYQRLLLLSLLLLPAAGNSSVRMDLAAGLGGQVVTGRPTELRVLLHADVATMAELHFSDANGDNSLSVEIDAGSATTLWLPVHPEAHRPLTLRLRSSDGQTIEARQNFEHRQTPITIVSRSVPVGQTLGSRPPPSSARPIIVSPTGFPHSSGAYAGVAAVVTDSASLSRLSSAQHRALAKYLGGCNVLLLAAASPAALQRVRELSGCGGRYVRSYDSLGQVYPLLRELGAERPPRMPEARELMPLRLPSLRAEMASSLTLYLAGYLIVMALLAWRIKKPQYLLVLPVVIAAAGVLAWHGGGSARLVTWAEAYSGDSHLRLSSLLLLGGDRRGNSGLTIDSRLSLLSIDTLPTARKLRWSSDQRRIELEARTRLLAPAAYLFDGLARRSPPFTLQMRQGQPLLTARLEQPVGDALLLWQGYSYPVPELARGDSWQPDQSQRQLPATAAERLLRRRLAFDAPALLMPYRKKPRELAAVDADSPAWLVIRHNPGQAL